MKRLFILTALFFPTLTSAGSLERITENAIGTGAGVYVGATLAGNGATAPATAPAPRAPSRPASIAVDGMSVSCELRYGQCLAEVNVWTRDTVLSIPDFLRKVAGPRAIMVQVIYQDRSIYAAPLAIIRYRMAP